jgi:hypothetical protein
MSTLRLSRRASASAAVALFVVASLAAMTSADQAFNYGPQLPHGVGWFYSATVWTGDGDAYTLGGINGNGPLPDVVKFTPANGQDAVHIANLDVGIHSISAVRDGDHIYVFGGVVNEQDTTAIRRFDISTGQTTIVAQLPTPRRFTEAFWDGTHAFIVGGWNPNWVPKYPHEIVQFTPSTGAVDVIVSEATHGELARHVLAGAGLTWDGTDAFIYGGGGCPDPAYPAQTLDACRDIVRFRPSTNELQIRQATLPEPRRGVSAFFDGAATTYVIGNETPTDVILRHKAGQDAAGDLEAMAAHLPVPRGHPNSFWNGTSAFILTGSGGGGFPPEIVGYDTRPGRPNNFDAQSNPAPPAEIRLTWYPPDANTFSDPITNYRLYRAPQGQPFAAYQLLGDVLTFTDSNVLPGQTYCYFVRAINVRGEGPPSVADCAPAI